MDFDALEARALAATDLEQRHTVFRELCRAVELDHARVERVRALTSGWSALERPGPAYTIHKLVDGRLPSSALSFLGGLRLFDLVLDEASGAPAPDDDRVRPFADRFEALRRWAAALPVDLPCGVEHLDWSYTAWRDDGGDPLAYADDPPGLDFRALDVDTVLTVLRSPLCARLRTLNLSKGPWLVESLTIESDHANAEDVMAGFMSRLEWEHLSTLPCAATLEHLGLHGTDLRLGDLGYDEGDMGFRYPSDRPPFPRLRSLDVSVGRRNLTGDVLARLVTRGAMPLLETFVAVDDLSERIAEAKAGAADDEDGLAWLDGHFNVRGMDAFSFFDIAEAPALRSIALGGALEAVRRSLAGEAIEVPERIALVERVAPVPDLVVPWIA